MHVVPGKNFGHIEKHMEIISLDLRFMGPTMKKFNHLTKIQIVLLVNHKTNKNNNTVS